MIKENKFNLEFNTTPHTVTRVVGGKIDIRNDATGQEYRRNIVHLKKVEGEWRAKSGRKQHYRGTSKLTNYSTVLISIKKL